MDKESPRRIPVIEMFGPTVQGEGMVIGQKTMFVRTAGCDYRCAWCDSAFTWDGSGQRDIRLLTASDILADLRRIGGYTFAHVTISGGNPALLPQLGELVALLHEQEMRVALETQGSRWQDWFWDIDELTLSPKPPSSGMKTDWDVLDTIVSRLEAGRAAEANAGAGASASASLPFVSPDCASPNTDATGFPPDPCGSAAANAFAGPSAGSRGAFSLKVVVFDEVDLAYAADVHERYPHVPFYAQAGNGRLGEAEPERLLPYLLDRYRWLIDRVMEHDRLKRVHVLPQLHTWVWGNKKGV